MKTFRQYLEMFFLLLFLLLFVGCELEDSDSDIPKPGYLKKMPEETSIGANTFGCYVNGELVAVRGRYQQQGGKPNYLGWYMQLVNGFYEMSDDYSKTMVLDIDVNKPNEGALHFLFKNPQKGFVECKVYYATSIEITPSGISEVGMAAVFSGSTDSAFVNIMNMDIDSQIICGRFDSISVVVENGVDSFNVFLTDGYFDVKYGQDF